jgi:lipid A 3-O-deacylase
MRRWFGRIGFAGAILLAACTASTSARADFGGLVAGGLGGFDILHKYTAAEGRLEFRFDQSLFWFKPLVGTFFTNKGSVYTYGGFRLELPVGKHLLIVPMATVGEYEKGSGKNLGSRIEFKTGVEIDLVFANGVRVGPVFDHVSNAGIGKNNPGEENFLMMVSVPLSIILP